MKYNKGDKVKVIDNWGDPRSCEVGDICTVLHQTTDNRVIATNERTGGEVGMFAKRFESYIEPHWTATGRYPTQPQFQEFPLCDAMIKSAYELLEKIEAQYHAEQEAKERAEAAAKRKLGPDWRPEPGEEYCRIGSDGTAKINKYSDCRGQQALANLDNAYPPEQYEELQESLRQRQRMMDLTRELGRPEKGDAYGYVVDMYGNESCRKTGELPRWMHVKGVSNAYRLSREFTAEQVQLIVKYL